MADQGRPDGLPQDSEQVLKEATERLQEHTRLWPRIHAVTSYLIPRREENGFSQGMLESFQAMRP